MIYKFSCHCGIDYTGKRSQRFHVRIDQHVTKIFKSLFHGRLEKPAKKYLSAIGQQLLDSHECARNDKEKYFSVLVKRRTLFSYIFWKPYVFNR